MAIYDFIVGLWDYITGLDRYYERKAMARRKECEVRPEDVTNEDIGRLTRNLVLDGLPEDDQRDIVAYHLTVENKWQRVIEKVWHSYNNTGRKE